MKLRVLSLVVLLGLILAACAPAATPTATAVPPTATSVPPTYTAVPSTATTMPTATPVPPTGTPLPPTATSVPPSATPRTPADGSLTILYTNDTHGHLDAFRVAQFPDPVGGVARRATLVEQIRKETKNVLLLDAGDVHQGILMADTYKGEPDIKFMNLLGYDAMGLGNHDVDWGWDIFQQRKTAAKFPFLSANLVDSASKKPALTPYVIKEVGGLKIAITSIAGPDVKNLVKATNIPGLEFGDSIAAAKALIPEMRSKADVVIVLGHQLVNEDKNLASSVPGIDIIIGGHEHANISEPVQVGNTYLVEDWQFGAYLGRLDITLKGGKLEVKNQLIPVLNSIQPNAEIDAEVKALVKKLTESNPERFAVLGEALVDITDLDIRQKESAIGNFAADIMRGEAKADIAFSTSSSFLNSIYKGPITLNALMEAIPYKNSLVTVKMTGAQVKQVLAACAKNIGKGLFCQVSGLSFTIKAGVLEEIKVAGAVLDEKKEYLVATTNYQADVAGDFKDIFAAGKEKVDTKKDVHEMIINFIKTNKQVSAKVEGRITIK